MAPIVADARAPMHILWAEMPIFSMIR